MQDGEAGRQQGQVRRESKGKRGEECTDSLRLIADALLATKPALTMREAARYTGLDVRRLREFIRMGLLKVSRVSPHTAFVAREELDRFMLGGNAATTAKKRSRPKPQEKADSQPKKEEEKPVTETEEKPPKQKEVFVKPTVAEVAEYASRQGYSINAEAFWNYYESKGWTVGKGKMKKWQASVALWNINEKRYGTAGGTPPITGHQFGLFEKDVGTRHVYSGDL